MNVRIRTLAGTTIEVPRETTLAELQAKLAALGQGNISDLNINWTPPPDEVREWGAPWPGADFSGPVAI